MTNEKFIQDFTKPLRLGASQDDAWYEPYKTASKRHRNLSWNYDLLRSYSAAIGWVPPPCNKQPYNGERIIFITDYNYSNTTAKHILQLLFYSQNENVLQISLYLPKDMVNIHKLEDLTASGVDKLRSLCLEFDDLYRTMSLVRIYKIERWQIMQQIVKSAHLLTKLFDIDPSDLKLKSNILCEYLFKMSDEAKKAFEDEIKDILRIDDKEWLLLK